MTSDVSTGAEGTGLDGAEGVAGRGAEGVAGRGVESRGVAGTGAEGTGADSKGAEGSGAEGSLSFLGTDGAGTCTCASGCARLFEGRLQHKDAAAGAAGQLASSSRVATLAATERLHRTAHATNIITINSKARQAAGLTREAKHG
jgi:hypothetical protein